MSQVAVQTTAKPTAMYQNNDIPRIAVQERVAPAPQTEVDTLESSQDDEVLQREEQRTVEQVAPAGKPPAELASGQQHPAKQVIDVSGGKSLGEVTSVLQRIVEQVLVVPAGLNVTLPQRYLQRVPAKAALVPWNKGPLARASAARVRTSRTRTCCEDGASRESPKRER